MMSDCKKKGVFAVVKLTNILCLFFTGNVWARPMNRVVVNT